MRAQDHIIWPRCSCDFKVGHDHKPDCQAGIRAKEEFVARKAALDKRP